MGLFDKDGDVPAKVEEAKKNVDFQKNRYEVVLHTTMGDIRLELFPDIAPNHCKNIISLAQIGFYDGIIFHRVVKDFVIQAGCPEGRGTGGPGYKVAAEFNNRLHEPGTLSMARTQDPNSAGSQFFLCLNKVPFLDRQYTVFGQSADQTSLDVILKIGAVKTDAGDRPQQDVTITKAEVITSPL